jgi:hypothetical protein
MPFSPFTQDRQVFPVVFNIMKSILVTISLIFVSGCSVTQVCTQIDSFSEKNSISKNRYILAPSDKDISPDNLEFKEYSGYIDRMLNERGFIKVFSTSDADVIIFFEYGIGDPQVKYYQYSIPVFGQTGVSSSSTVGNLNTIGNTTTYSGNTTYTKTYGITGSTTHTGSVTLYKRMFVLDAYDYHDIINNVKTQLWKITAISEGQTNDLREIIPYMILSAKPYIGVSSGKKINIYLNKDDKTVKTLKDSN